PLALRHRGRQLPPRWPQLIVGAEARRRRPQRLPPRRALFGSLALESIEVLALAPLHGLSLEARARRALDALARSRARALSLEDRTVGALGALEAQRS